MAKWYLLEFTVRQLTVFYPDEMQGSLTEKSTRGANKFAAPSELHTF